MNKLPSQKKDLIVRRQKAYDLIKSLYNSGTALRTSPYNEDVVFGQDLGGTKDGRYLPAIQEYIGRFYNEGGLGSEGLKKMISSGHHVLILSGLYGFLCPDELIQLYECPLEDLPEFQQFWSRDDAITEVLVEYIRMMGIRNVIDLTAQQEYRNLVDWSAVREEDGVRVFHTHSKHFAGQEGLPFLGKFSRNTLFEMTDVDFEKIDGIFVKDFCCLSPSVIPPEGWPMEESARIQKVLYGPESSQVEYKPVLTGSLIDLPTSMRFNDMKYRVMKNVVAMMNSDGGEILIGIEDDRSVKGIDRERDALHRYALKNGEKAEADDLYLQIFDRMVELYIGKTAVRYVKPRFWTYMKKTILIVQVQPSQSKESLKIGKDGQQLMQEEYWIRGNSGDKRVTPKEIVKNNRVG